VTSDHHSAGQDSDRPPASRGPAAAATVAVTRLSAWQHGRPDRLQPCTKHSLPAALQDRLQGALIHDRAPAPATRDVYLQPTGDMADCVKRLTLSAPHSTNQPDRFNYTQAYIIQRTNCSRHRR